MKWQKERDLLIAQTMAFVQSIAGAKPELESRAAENRIFLLTANRVGRERTGEFCGWSQIVDPFGVRLAEAGPTEIMVVADISGSVASFARFTLQFVYAMASQFSKVRSWVFIDGIDEVTRFFQESDDIAEAIHRVNTEADVVWVDGHSDYGHAFEVFHERHYKEVTPKSSIILLGDARNNYHASQHWVLKELQQRARHLYWLNPEPRGYWDTGDSIISEFGIYCDGVYECRNLRQLERFVTTIVEG